MNRCRGQIDSTVAFKRIRTLEGKGISGSCASQISVNGLKLRRSFFFEINAATNRKAVLCNRPTIGLIKTLHISHSCSAHVKTTRNEKFREEHVFLHSI
jgi:hypothetical protein